MLVKPAYPSTLTPSELISPNALASAVGIQYWPFTGLVAARLAAAAVSPMALALLAGSALAAEQKDRGHVGFAFAERESLQCLTVDFAVTHINRDRHRIAEMTFVKGDDVGDSLAKSGGARRWQRLRRRQR